MPKIGKKVGIVQVIHQKTKVKQVEIYDVLRVLSDTIAETIMQKGLKEKEVLHLGFISVYWQSSLTNKPEIVFLPPDRVKKRFAELKFERKTTLAQHLYNQLPPHLKEKMENKKSRLKEKKDPS